MTKILITAIYCALAQPAAAQQTPPPTEGKPQQPRASLSTFFNNYSPERMAASRAGARGEALLGSFGGLALRASAEGTRILTRDNGYFPPELYKTALTITAEDKVTRLAVNLNSNSDKPFYSPSETDLGFNFSRTFSERGAHAWLFGLNYSTRRSFSRSIPLPFITYRYASKDFFLLFPFLLRWQASRKISFAVSYQPVKYYRLSASWRPAPFFNTTLEGGTGLEQFLVAGRTAKDSALYYETAFLLLKPELYLSRRLRLGAEVGWQFNGRYYTGKTYNDHRATTSTGCGPSAGLSAGYNF